MIHRQRLLAPQEVSTGQTADSTPCVCALQGCGSMQGRSQGGTRRDSASSEERRGWGQVMQLSGVGSAGYASPPPEHLSRSNSEGWELLHHDECDTHACCELMFCIATTKHTSKQESQLCAITM